MLDWMGQPTALPLILPVIEIVRKSFLVPLALWFAFRSYKKLFALTIFPSGIALIKLCIIVIICSLIYFCKPTVSSCKPYYVCP